MLYLDQIIRNIKKLAAENGGSIHEKIPAKKQRELFGAVLFGRATVHYGIGDREITGSVKVCFGADFHEPYSLDLVSGLYCNERLLPSPVQRFCILNKNRIINNLRNSI